MTDAPERIWAGWRGAEMSTSAEDRPFAYVRDAAPKDGTLRLHRVLREVDASPTKSMVWVVGGRLYRVQAMPAPPKEGE